MSITFRVSDKEMSIIKSYADIHGTTVSDAVREAILEKIEDEFDLQIYTRAMEEHKEDKKIYTHEEMLNELDLP